MFAEINILARFRNFVFAASADRDQPCTVVQVRSWSVLFVIQSVIFLFLPCKYDEWYCPKKAPLKYNQSINMFVEYTDEKKMNVFSKQKLIMIWFILMLKFTFLFKTKSHNPCVWTSEFYTRKYNHTFKAIPEKYQVSADNARPRVLALLECRLTQEQIS